VRDGVGVGEEEGEVPEEGEGVTEGVEEGLPQSKRLSTLHVGQPVGPSATTSAPPGRMATLVGFWSWDTPQKPSTVPATPIPHSVEVDPGTPGPSAAPTVRIL